MTLSFLAFAISGWLGAGFDESAAVELRYTGALVRTVQAAEGTARKRFSLYALVSREPQSARRVAWFVSERGGGGWAWPERFGAMSFDPDLKRVSGGAIRLLYDYEGNPVAIPLPLPIVEFHTRLKPGAKWNDAKETWEVGKPQKLQDRECWPVQVTSSFGRVRTLWIETAAPVVVALEERVFGGQGDEHTLTMQLESTKPLDEMELQRDTKALPALLRLQSDLKRNDGEHRGELSDEQLKLAASELATLQKDAADSPFSALVTAIAKDVRTQLQRTDEVARLAEKFVGKPAPDFDLNLIDKSQVERDTLQGKITVLHFWEYQAEPLVEPYGQVGYVDFLSGKRRKLGVNVFGVAVDPRLADGQGSAAALKSIQRLRQFMNLSYPIAIDDGKLLASFGDPRRYGAKLPLWVVIDADGKIAHYRSGLYQINPDAGLEELDAVLVKLIRDRREREKPQ